MAREQRHHPRIQKPLTMQYCRADLFPRKWDMSVIDNISLGGVRFKASSDLELNNKIIQLQILIPELAPRFLELEAIVLEVKPHSNINSCDIRARFISVSDKNKEYLAVIEKIIDIQKNKDIKK